MQSPSCVGLLSCVLPEVKESVKSSNSQIGVSTNSVLSRTLSGPNGNVVDTPHWYALRATYGREKKACDYLASKNVVSFYPTLKSVKIVNGKHTVVEESRIPNIFFAYGTEEELKSFVYDNVNLPFLRFYYRHTHVGKKIVKVPLVVPDSQMNSLKIICDANADNTVVLLSEVTKFEKGQLVRITDGIFNGVIGRVARWQGQQRVGVVVEDLVTVMTAYVPSAFLEKIDL